MLMELYCKKITATTKYDEKILRFSSRCVIVKLQNQEVYIMLQNYSLEGFKSFKHYTEVDMKKTQYQTLEKDNVVDGILKGCMFVGGNASGKTND